MHLYIVFQNPKAHTVIANAFSGAHREPVRGTSQQNRDYILKDGATNIEIVDSFPYAMLNLGNVNRTCSILHDSEFASE